jgi:hypothetical protein
MVTSSSPTRGVIKMDEGEISELADFFKKTIVTEADRRRTMISAGYPVI